MEHMWNILVYEHILYMSIVTIESIEHWSRHSCSPSPSHPTWFSHGNNCAKHGYLHGSLAVTGKIVIFAHMSTPSAASSAVLFRKHWISWAVQDPVNDLVFRGSFARCLQARQKNFFSGRGYIFPPQSPTRYTKSTKNAGYDYYQKDILYTIKDSSRNWQETRTAQNPCFINDSILRSTVHTQSTLSPPPRFQEFDHVNIFRLRKVKLRSGKRRVMQGPHLTQFCSAAIAVDFCLLALRIGNSGWLLSNIKLRTKARRRSRGRTAYLTEFAVQHSSI